MDSNDGNRDDHGCPFINQDDDRCAKHFTLGRIDDALSVCLHQYKPCPTYHQILIERGKQAGCRFEQRAGTSAPAQTTRRRPVVARIAQAAQHLLAGLRPTRS